MTASPARDEVHPLRVANALLRERTLVVRTALVVVVLFTTPILIQRRDWTTTAAFMPQSRSAQSSNLSTLAAQFGVPVPGASGTPLLPFYSDLVKARAILEDVATAEYSVVDRGDTLRGRAAVFLRVRQADPAVRLFETLRELDKAVTASAVQRTGVVRVSVTSTYPQFSALVARRILDLVNQFNLRTRQSQAAAERRFVEQRVGEIRSELRQAENRLADFLLRNRDYRDSPDLTFAYDRLARDVAMQQQVYTGLAQSLEQAKIDEVRDTPVITVIEQPVAAVRPDPRGLVVRAIAAVLAGTILGVLLALLRQASTNLGTTEPDDVAEFRRGWALTLRDARRPWRLVVPLPHARAPEPALDASPETSPRE